MRKILNIILLTACTATFAMEYNSSSMETVLIEINKLDDDKLKKLPKFIDKWQKKFNKDRTKFIEQYVDHKNRNILHNACKYNLRAVVKIISKLTTKEEFHKLLSAIDKLKSLPIHVACKHDAVETVYELFDRMDGNDLKNFLHRNESILSMANKALYLQSSPDMTRALLPYTRTIEQIARIEITEITTKPEDFLPHSPRYSDQKQRLFLNKTGVHVLFEQQKRVYGNEKIVEPVGVLADATGNRVIYAQEILDMKAALNEQNKNCTLF